MLTQARLKELLHYDPDTGVFTRRYKFNQYEKGVRVGSLDVHGYMQFRIDGKNYKMHRLAWLYICGELPDGPLDHKNLVRHDNRIDNLRMLLPNQHVEHRSNNKNNKSGFRGVHMCRYTGRWVAQIKSNYQTMWLGRFDTPEAAHAAYVSAATLYHTHNPAGEK